MSNLPELFFASTFNPFGLNKPEIYFGDLLAASAFLGIARYFVLFGKMTIGLNARSMPLIFRLT